MACQLLSLDERLLLQEQRLRRWLERRRLVEEMRLRLRICPCL